MAYATWPQALPIPNRQGFVRSLIDARLRAPADAGPRRTRRRISRPGSTYAMTMICSRGQLALLDTFYTVTLVEGSNLFLMADYMTHGWALAGTDGGILTTPQGVPLGMTKIMLVQFDALYEVAPLGAEFSVSFSVTEMPL